MYYGADLERYLPIYSLHIEKHSQEMLGQMAVGWLLELKVKVNDVAMYDVEDDSHDDVYVDVQHDDYNNVDIYNVHDDGGDGNFNGIHDDCDDNVFNDDMCDAHDDDEVDIHVDDWDVQHCNKMMKIMVVMMIL